ncbi:TlpA family protein disulfide reductase [Pseudotenacibaculum haliotis]|uniref:Thioredoxin-like domain-containing protein n=1 Tax=Pseudotenacibaculum haliotis TaxID=1862138 RepID=A0ABW5LWG7_9FLAO
MRKLLVIVSLLFLWSCSKAPTEFSEKALGEILLNRNNEEVLFKDILEKYRGEKILIDVWASWCKDCIIGLPNLKKLQSENQNVQYVFLSLDRTSKSWKRGVDRFQIKGDHYFMKEGKKGALGEFLNLWWIPRYVVVDESGRIALFKATKITDKKILEALKK